MEIFTYRSREVRIIPDTRKGKAIYWIIVNGTPMSFVSNPETAKRYAINFLDVALGEEYQTSRHGHMNPQGEKYDRLSDYNKKYN